MSIRSASVKANSLSCTSASIFLEEPPSENEISMDELINHFDLIKERSNHHGAVRENHLFWRVFYDFSRVSGSKLQKGKMLR
jgi:hypothetical protein